jgi:hypothetical protein
MKKLLVTLLGVVIVGGAIFHACKKEDKVFVNNDVNKVQKCILVEYEEIDNLIEQTGININDLSNASYINDVASAIWTDMETLMTKEPLSIESLNEMQNLTVQLNFANDAGDYNGILSFSMQFSEIVNNNIGFFHNNNMYDLQDFEYNGQIYSLPIQYMEDMQEQAISLWEGINADYSNFENLNSDLQIEVISIALLLNLETRYDLPLEPTQLETCTRSAGISLTVALTAATAVYTAGLAGCSAYVHPVAIGGCMLYVTGVYGYACYSAYDTYATKVENCQLKYGN